MEVELRHATDGREEIHVKLRASTNRDLISLWNICGINNGAGQRYLFRVRFRWHISTGLKGW